MTVIAEALLFDLDGLMIDSEPLWQGVEHAIAASYGKVWSDELARACQGTGLPNTIRVMRETLGIPLEDAEGVERLISEFVERLPDLRLQPGCRELVGAAHGRIPMAVASSNKRRLVEPIVAHFGLLGFFAAVVTGDDVHRTKPEPDIFLYAAERLGRPAAGCVVLEDSIAGVAAGVAAGMAVLAVPTMPDERFGQMTPHVLKDLHEARLLLGL